MSESSKKVEYTVHKTEEKKEDWCTVKITTVTKIENRNHRRYNGQGEWFPTSGGPPFFQDTKVVTVEGPCDILKSIMQKIGQDS